MAGKSTEKFKQWLVSQLANLKPERKEEVIDILIQTFVDALGDVGVHIEVQRKINEEFPPEMEDFISLFTNKNTVKKLK